MIWYYYDAYAACVQTFRVRNIISTSKLSKVERTVINIVMSNNSDGSGHHAGLTPKQTSPGRNNYNMITASSGKKKNEYEYEDEYTMSQ